MFDQGDIAPKAGDHGSDPAAKRSYRVIFRYRGKHHFLTIGRVSEDEAKTKAGQADYLLMRLKQGLIAVPAGCDIKTFVEHDGNPPASKSLTRHPTARNTRWP